MRSLMSGMALAAAAANVVMQLSRLPVGHGVVESTVESGRLDKHPIKRTRTTLSYLMIALGGFAAGIAATGLIKRGRRKVVAALIAFVLGLGIASARNVWPMAAR